MQGEHLLAGSCILKQGFIDEAPARASAALEWAGMRFGVPYSMDLQGLDRLTTDLQSAAVVPDDEMCAGIAALAGEATRPFGGEWHLGESSDEVGPVPYIRICGRVFYPWLEVMAIRHRASDDWKSVYGAARVAVRRPGGW